jgi:MarR family transcriptional regulator for hemolysin
MTAFTKSINVLYRCAVLFRSEKLKVTGLNGYQNTYISNICRNPGISQEQLSKLIYINKSNVTRQLAALEQLGYITRKPSPADKRSLLVYPTSKAQEVYPYIQQILGEWNNYLTSDFTEEERGQLNSMMERMMEKASSYVTETTLRKKGK